MQKLLLASALPLLVGLTSAFLVRPDWAFDAGIFYAFWAMLAVIVALAVNSAAVRLRRIGAGGFFEPGLLTVAQTFWVTMTINIGIGCLLLQLDASQHRTGNHAIEAEAFLALVIGVLAALVCVAFAVIRWWPIRLLLATASGCTSAFACMAITWWR